MAASESRATAVDEAAAKLVAELSGGAAVAGCTVQLSHGVEQQTEDVLTASLESLATASDPSPGGGACCPEDVELEGLEHLSGRIVRPIPKGLAAG